MKFVKRNPILSLVNDFFIDSPLPANITYFWNTGSLLGVVLVIQILTGVTLAMHYTPNTLYAFASVEHIMRDVNYGWLLRYLHANGASFFFIVVYLHIGRGLYFASYRPPRIILWTVGVVIYIVMMANLVWPSWYSMDEVSYFFIYPNIWASKRIGPHNHDVLAQIICGLLGDWWGNRIPSKGGFSYRFEIDQDDTNHHYVKYLTQWFYDRGYCASFKPIVRKRVDKGRFRRISRLTLFTFRSFDWIFDAFYSYDSITNRRVKTVPLWIKDYLTPAGLAAWIMQDGSAQPGAGVYIATNSFSKKDCEFLAKTLQELFDLKVTVISAGYANQWRLNIWKESVSHLQSIVKDFIIPELLYKVHL